MISTENILIGSIIRVNWIYLGIYILHTHIDITFTHTYYTLIYTLYTCIHAIAITIFLSDRLEFPEPDWLLTTSVTLGKVLRFSRSVK